MIYEEALKQARDQQKANKAFLKTLKRLKPKDLDDQFHSLHEEVFEEVDCLECANCCKTTSPIFQMADIERLARVLKMKVPLFIDTYLYLDEEHDYVLKSAPCPFLGADNKCIVYENRPKACREYPHTNRKRMYQITDLTFKNTLVCPAVSQIVRKLSESYNQ
ncbi:MAG: YkgJ family cysteine cluster protein [Marinoscillum sp.]|uniref:YkgJ family cysteine cluster protein n=1 Tax=Marinoscillum sp. TaxID=2024838 RepID=UPI0033008E49